MSSTQGSNPSAFNVHRNAGSARIHNAIVYYLYDAPTDKAVLKAELLVIQSFVNSWNKGLGDDPKLTGTSTRKCSLLPSGSVVPPPIDVVLVTSGHHRSTHPKIKNQLEHITLLVSTVENLKMNPPQATHPIHVFSVDAMPVNGYEGYYLHKTGILKLDNENTLKGLVNSKKRSFGTLGEGDLA